MKWSRIAIPTLKEKPADAEIASHELLVRAGMMRAVAAGIFTFLPLGQRVLGRVEDIVREEMNRAGALEIMLPALQPGEFWEESGRWAEYGPEMVRVKDRQDRDFCLAPTAEELITKTVAQIAPSYRDLPVNLYQIQTKYRDEIRPRFGLLRAREFRMKDAYSFHADLDDLDREYADMYGAYCRIADRCALDYRVVEAATGLIGGDVSHEFMVLSQVGEDTVTYCSSCDYGANAELEKYAPGEDRLGGEGEDGPAEVHTPGHTAVVDVADYLGVDIHQVLKCLLYVVEGKRLRIRLSHIQKFTRMAR